MGKKQNITLRLDQGTLNKAKDLAAERRTSVSAMLTMTIEEMAAREDAYDQARRRALARLKRGFHLGGRIRASRGELHDREGLRRH